MSTALFRRLLLGAVACVLAFPGSVAAADTGRVLLGFAQRYTAPDGSQFTHHGQDIAGEPGAEVPAPRGGRVKFAGRVPGPHGGSVNVVTIEVGTDLISLLPLDELRVVTGDQIAQGATVGLLAASGDASSASPHLHVGLRRSGVYIDPDGLFNAWTQNRSTAGSSPEQSVSPVSEPGHATSGPAVSAAAPVQVPVLAPSPSPVAAPLPGVSPAPKPLITASPVTLPGAVATAEPVGAGGAARRPALAGQPARSAAGPSTSMAEAGVESGPGLTASRMAKDAASVAAAPPESGSVQDTRIGAARATVSGTFTVAESTPLAAVTSLCRELLFLLREQPAAFGALAAAVLGSAVLLTRRSLLRISTSQQPVSDRLGIMLRALRTGDTIHGFTSCSGHSAFTDPGPPAQRR